MATSTLHVQDATLKAARFAIQEQLAPGIVVIRETVLEDGASKTVHAEGTTADDAALKVKLRLPDHAVLDDERVTQEATSEALQVAAFDENDAWQKARDAVLRPKRIESVSLTTSGRTGCLTIRRSPNTYSVFITQPAVVMATYRAPVRICADVGTLVDSEAFRYISDERWEDLVQIGALASPAILLALRSLPRHVGISVPDCWAMERRAEALAAALVAVQPPVAELIDALTAAPHFDNQAMTSVHETIYTSLGARQETQGVSHLITAMKQQSVGHYQAIHALGQIPDARVVPALLEQLRVGQYPVHANLVDRYWLLIVDTLVLAGGVSVLGDLERILSSVPKEVEVDEINDQWGGSITYRVANPKHTAIVGAIHKARGVH